MSDTASAVIRIATSGDRPRVAALYAELGYRSTAEAGDRLVLAEEGGRLIGVVRLASERGVTVLRGMRVLPAHQHRGVGTAMLRAVESELGSAACFGIAYEHLKSFYARIGFREASADEVPRFLADRLAGYRAEHPDTKLYAMFRPGSAAADRGTHEVSLREVVDSDLPLFYEHQADPVAYEMAAFPPRDEAAFMAHWTKIRADATVMQRTVLFDGLVAGNVVSFDRFGMREVGYWIGREYWGRGIASRALSQYLTHETRRPLVARVAKHNVASLRVLQKCGFVLAREEGASASAPADQVEEVFLRLES